MGFPGESAQRSASWRTSTFALNALERVPESPRVAQFSQGFGKAMAGSTMRVSADNPGSGNSSEGVAHVGRLFNSWPGLFTC
jgi:hypothetical protein